MADDNETILKWCQRVVADYVRDFGEPPTTLYPADDMDRLDMIKARAAEKTPKPETPEALRKSASTVAPEGFIALGDAAKKYKISRYALDKLLSTPGVEVEVQRPHPKRAFARIEQIEAEIRILKAKPPEPKKTTFNDPPAHVRAKSKKSC